MKKVTRFLIGLGSAAMLCLAIASCEKDHAVKAGNPAAAALSPDSASGGAVVTLTGSGLGAIRSIVFDKGNVPAPFNPTLNTDGAVIFRVPDTANGGPQHIVFTNSDGKSVTVSFKVIALPTVSDVSNYNFTNGTQLTLTGNNLDDVSSVVFTGTSTSVTIVSKTKRNLVIRMPATTLNRSKLDITNASGKMTTSQEFVYLDNAFQLFTDDYAPGYQDASWGDPGVVSSTVSKSGTKSVGKKFAAGQWHQLGFGWTNINKLTPTYTYLSFWIKGASVDYPLWISSSASTGGFASFNDNAKINVPANVWTYFKIPLSQLDLWATANSFNQLGWRIQGPNGQDETFYLDDVIFVK